MQAVPHDPCRHLDRALVCSLGGDGASPPEPTTKDRSRVDAEMAAVTAKTTLVCHWDTGKACARSACGLSDKDRLNAAQALNKVLAQLFHSNICRAHAGYIKMRTCLSVLVEQRPMRKAGREA